MHPTYFIPRPKNSLVGRRRACVFVFYGQSQGFLFLFCIFLYLFNGESLLLRLTTFYVIVLVFACFCVYFLCFYVVLVYEE